MPGSEVHGQAAVAELLFQTHNKESKAMGTRPHTCSAERSLAIPTLVLGLLVVSAVAGCSSTPRLTVEDRRSDVEYRVRWGKDYHACVEVNSKGGRHA